ncbi:hypothetical protein N476_18250 [Pseudoalteromonas luteoviolacea H33]|uniref:Uncharacterized protein n=1 Tax=Pseudoalteromonas luteoviolacea H33 TaxID=1365251 RepID=A0A162AGW7_9GAMM|nr:hypothetical protein N476_18250 [Pseudoalteromonas luteoviolacea H33]KZN77758.1 hypothetical protein N477_00705 [Pseudoalteromonas luteoviolacea H33-S]
MLCGQLLAFIFLCRVIIYDLYTKPLFISLCTHSMKTCGFFHSSLEKCRTRQNSVKLRQSFHSNRQNDITDFYQAQKSVIIITAASVKAVPYDQ